MDMPHENKKSKVLRNVIFATSLIVTLWFLPVNAADLIHDKQADMSDYSAGALKAIFTRKRMFWGNGERIHVFIKPVNSIEHRLFLTQWLGITTYRYKKLLKVQLYSGRNSGVQIVNSDQQMMVSLLQTPYAIGYMADGTVMQNINGELELVVIFYE